MGNWVVLSDNGILQTVANEVGHQFGYNHFHDSDSDNLMYRFIIPKALELHNHPYPQCDNNGTISGDSNKRQLDEVN